MVTSSPVSSSTATTSVNVPPVSMPIRIRRGVGAAMPQIQAVRRPAGPRHILPTDGDPLAPPASGGGPDGRPIWGGPPSRGRPDSRDGSASSRLVESILVVGLLASCGGTPTPPPSRPPLDGGDQQRRASKASPSVAAASGSTSPASAPALQDDPWRAGAEAGEVEPLAATDGEALRQRVAAGHHGGGGGRLGGGVGRNPPQLASEPHDENAFDQTGRHSHLSSLGVPCSGGHPRSGVRPGHPGWQVMTRHPGPVGNMCRRRRRGAAG